MRCRRCCACAHARAIVTRTLHTTNVECENVTNRTNADAVRQQLVSDSSKCRKRCFERVDVVHVSSLRSSASDGASEDPDRRDVGRRASCGDPVPRPRFHHDASSQDASLAQRGARESRTCDVSIERGPVAPGAAALTKDGRAAPAVPHGGSLLVCSRVSTVHVGRERRVRGNAGPASDVVDEQLRSPSQHPERSLPADRDRRSALPRQSVGHDDLLRRLTSPRHATNDRSCRSATASCARSVTPSIASDRMNRCTRP